MDLSSWLRTSAPTRFPATQYPGARPGANAATAMAITSRIGMLSRPVKLCIKEVMESLRNCSTKRL